MTLGEYVKREKSRVTVLARKLKRSRQIIYKYCDGTCIPGLKTASEIEELTAGAVTLYDWVDTRPEERISIDNI